MPQQDVSEIIIKALAIQRQSTPNVDLVRAEYLKSQDPQVVIRTFEELDKRLDSWLTMGRTAVHGMALDLYQLDSVWKMLPTEFTSKWNYSFVNYAVERTGSGWDTVKSYIRMAETFLSGKVAVKGQPKDFNPYNIHFSKLVLVTSAARDGKMDAETWSKLMNPETKFEALRDEVHRIRLGESTGRKNYSYFCVEDGLLFFVDAGHKVTIGSLDEDPQFETTEENELAQKGLQRAKILLRVKEGPQATVAQEDF